MKYTYSFMDWNVLLYTLQTLISMFYMCFLSLTNFDSFQG